MNTHKQDGGTILGLFIGLVFGVVAAAGVVWYLNKTPLPFQAKVGKPAGEAKVDPAKAAAVPGAPQPLPGKPGDKVQEKPRFEFYKILPGAEEPVPRAAPPPPPPPRAPRAHALPPPPAPSPTPPDADNLKARLALMGVEAGVQQVTLPEKGVMHRVRIGPYANPDEMAKARTLLAQNGIQASVVRVKDGKDTKDVPN